MSEPVEQPPTTQATDMKAVGISLGFIGAGVVVFIVCSLVQGAFGSSMFSNRYRDPGVVGAILINLTFFPGWIATIVLAAFGAFGLWATLSKG